MENEKRKIPTNFGSSRFDQQTFWGRLRHFYTVTDPRTLWTSQSTLDEALAVIQDYESGELDADGDKEKEERVWNALRIRDAMVHPDTGETIIAPLRFSAFAPMNVLICSGLLASAPTFTSIVGWQWFNQTYNVAVNHANRNASNPMSNAQIATAYAAAVTVSCALALGLDKLTSRSKSAALRMLVPFAAVSTAGIVNVAIMRGNEMRDGIDLYEPDNDQLIGKSAIAGQHAVARAAISRTTVSAACLTVPPIVMALLKRTQFMRARPSLHGPFQLGVIAATLFSAVPAGIALFPQRFYIEPASLEKRFHALKQSDGTPIERVYFNRGL